MGNAYGVETHGILWVIAQQVNRGECGEMAAEALVNALLDSGARFPFERGGFCAWAKRVGVLTA